MKFDVIYADPAWTYDRKWNSENKTKSGMQGACMKYDLMEDFDMSKLPISDIAKDNCALFLWVTFPKLQEGLDLIKAWGFKYITLGFNYIKLNKKQDTPFFGTGYYTRASSEICLFAKKGKVTPITKKISSILQSNGYISITERIDQMINSFQVIEDSVCPRLKDLYKPVIDVCKKELQTLIKEMGQILDYDGSLIFERLPANHSFKPIRVRELIVELLGKDKSYVELFARNTDEYPILKKYDGQWVYVGNEIGETPGLDIRDAIEQIKNNTYIKDMVKYETQMP